MGDGHYTIDRYVLDTLLRDLVGHDHRASAFLVYLGVAAASEEGASHLSHAQMAERTGLSKRSVQNGVLHLVDRNLLRVTRRGATDVCGYEPLTPWRQRPSAGCETPP